MSQNSSALDVEEMINLATIASESRDYEKALLLLRQAMEVQPRDGRIHYLVGAVHAQIGMYGRAIDDMTRAVEFSPDLHTAVFHLGLLLITSGRLEDAANTWQSLDQLGEDHPLFLFKTGMLHLANDRFDECLSAIKRGIELNTFNLPLNKDMQKVIDAVQTLKNTTSNDGGNGGSLSSGGRNVLISSYENDDDPTSH